MPAASGCGRIERGIPVESENTRRCGPQAPVSAGSLWFIGWLFTIGFTHPGFWKAVLGLLIWPYFLGTAIRP